MIGKGYSFSICVLGWNIVTQQHMYSRTSKERYQLVVVERLSRCKLFLTKLSSNPIGNMENGKRIYCGVGVQLSTSADTQLDKLESNQILRHSLIPWK